MARLEEQRTATYCAVITESGELSLGLGDMDVHEQITEQYVSSATDHGILICQAFPGFMFQCFSISEQYSLLVHFKSLNMFFKVSQFEKQLSLAPLVCLDGNIPVSTIDYVCSIAKKHNINGKQLISQL